MLKISLKAARVNAGLSQDDVCKIVHKTNKTLVNWENGKTNIDYGNLETLCRLYKIDRKYIFLPYKLKMLSL